MAKTTIRVCAVVGCVCAPEPNAEVCAVHRQAPNLSPSDADRCEACKGTGECRHCDTSGQVECRCHCGNYHDTDCGACDGSGECAKCQGSGVAAKVAK